MAGKPGRNIKHGHATRVDGNHKGTREYRIWLGMRRRCNDSGSTPYRYYGGRGIRVCERWSEFATFIADMGPCPDGMTIDRLDSNGNYEPSNCRWADRVTQAQNSSRAKLTHATAQEMRNLKANGVRTREIAARFGVHKSTVERVLSGDRWNNSLPSATEGSGKP